MAGETNPATPPAGDPGTPPAGNPPSDPPKEPGPEPKTFDAAYVENLRKESADYRTKLRAAEAKLEERAKADMSETERAKKEAADATAKVQEFEAKLKASNTRAETATLAASLKIVDADAAFRLLDQAAIQYDDDGKPTNLKPLLEALVKDKPFLIATPGPSTNPNNPGREGAKEMSRAAYNQMTLQAQSAYIRGGGKLVD